MGDFKFPNQPPGNPPPQAPPQLPPRMQDPYGVSPAGAGIAPPVEGDVWQAPPVAGAGQYGRPEPGVKPPQSFMGPPVPPGPAGIATQRQAPPAIRPSQPPPAPMPPTQAPMRQPMPRQGSAGSPLAGGGPVPPVRQPPNPGRQPPPYPTKYPVR